MLFALPFLTAALSLAANPVSACPRVDLFRDDFSRFPAGPLTVPVPGVGGAIQECHHLEHRGVPLGPWGNAICHLDAWVAGDEDGVPYVEQHLVNEVQMQTPLFVTGDEAWADYSVQVRVRPLSLADLVGIAFRYKTNHHHYLFALSGGKEARLLVREPREVAFRQARWREIAKAPFVYDTRAWRTLRVDNDGPRIRAFVDGKLVIDASDGELLRGKVALMANVPARFADVRVTTCAQTKTTLDRTLATRADELNRLRAANPRPLLWRQFSTRGFGAGRNVRFGDLDGDGRVDMLIAQNIPRVTRDAFSHISAMTAVTLEGRVLWQVGRPDPRNTLLTNDTPFQIQDVDGDGRNDVLVVKDFKIQLLDGRTGKVKRQVWMPAAPPAKTAQGRPYELYSGDAITFVNLTGRPGRRDFLLKDRYKQIWAFSRDLKLLWTGQENTGHFPVARDLDGDGRDELFIGYGLWSPNGQRRWTLDGKIGEHADTISVGRFGADPKGPERIYWTASDDGLVVLDLAGNVLAHQRVGHTQNAAWGKFRPDLPGLQLMTVNYWKSPGIVTLFDADGKILEQGEPIHSGSPMLPVNWRGDGQELVLLSGSPRTGGMIDGQLRRVVMFPDDGHADLAAAVLNVTGDARDEIILWDPDSVWIYTQDAPFTGERLYAPVRDPLYNESNYKAHLSLPGWARPQVSAAGGARSGTPSPAPAGSSAADRTR